MKKNEKGFSLVEALLVSVIVGLVVLVGWYVLQNNKETEPEAANQSQDAQTPPDSNSSIVKTIENFDQTFTLEDIDGVSVKHDSSWTPGKSFEGFSPSTLIKTGEDRSYRIGFQENDTDYLAKDGNYAQDLKLYKQISINDKPHYVVTSRNEYAYLTSCPPKDDEACSPQTADGYLFIILNQEVSDAQYPVGLNFNREDDQKILAEFADILLTLKY